MKHLLLFGAIIFGITSCNNTSSSNDSAMESPAPARLIEKDLDYKDDSAQLKGFVVYSDSIKGKRPVVLVVHEWWGLEDYSKERARQLARMGYLAMAVDMYGAGKLAANPQEAMSLAGPFYAKPQMAQQRLDAARAALRPMEQGDTSQVAAIGYCFGGSMVLNAARLGSPYTGVVSFHGGLANLKPEQKPNAAILVCHGGADGFVPSADSAAFRAGMDAVNASYQFITYPGAKHAFTNPAATSKGQQFNLDIAYNAAADSASWKDMQGFFGRIFKK